MGQQYNELSVDHQNFISLQKVFFIGTATADGKVNVSPKGMDTFRVLNEKQVVWLNLTGSGNETASHLLKFNRITIMFCSFEKKPLILRLYGTAKILHQRDKEWKDYIHLFPSLQGARQIFVVDLDLVQTSCGYAVPLLDFKEERQVLKKWADVKGEEGIREYWKEKNMKDLDGRATEIL